MSDEASAVPPGPPVLVARLDNAGDVLLAGPAVRAVAAAAGPVTFLCGPAGREAASLLPGVGEVLTYDAPWVPLEARPVDRASIDGLVDAVGRGGITTALVLTSFHQSPLPLALLLKMAGVSTVAATSEDHPGSLVDVRRRPDQDAGRHEVQRSLALAAAAGFALPPGDDGRLAVRRPLPATAPFDEPYVVVHPGASVPARGLPVAAARDLVAWLAAQGPPVVVTGGPDETELAAAVAGCGAPDVRIHAGRTTLAALAGLLAAAAVAVTGNTGPAHLAAAVGTPVVSVFAPVVPVERWRPWGVPGAVLGDHAIACAGCRARICPFPGQPCLAPVTAEALVEAVLPWLAPALAGSRGWGSGSLGRGGWGG